MPYRPISVRTPGARVETFLTRVTDAALAEWLVERSRLRRLGYPDRPPDIDARTVRLWLARPGEERLAYFAAARARLPATSFPVYSVTWHRGDAEGAKVLVTGFADGSFLSRVVLEGVAGEPRIEKARRYPPEMDPADVWQQVETIVAVTDHAPGGWERGDRLVTDYVDLQALDAEIALAEAEARAAGLLAPRRFDA